ncbi:hypothetical protein [Paraflavitalea sp. CAU 1676]|uniref:hypothetical protein n=1 Tax=Paraflavitalea sp. CAU 1676 TaxID=3032598 RepID=UPI0023DC8BE7|nr:hypothetical protein [Paraflavitalea sp. CAU 1676]MDF2192086.1 hypothetical protein [Paraflavitalea sp. CAU 1676]
MLKPTEFKPSFFWWMSLVALIAVHIGFAKTYLAPVTAGTFSAPVVVYVHGALAFGWIFLYFVQTTLAGFHQYLLHAIVGIIALLTAVGAAVTMPSLGVYAVQKELRQGLGETAVSGIVGVFTSAIMFLALVIAGVLNRAYGAIHKRLMLLATIVILWPAWFRFRHYFPSVPRPDIWFAVVLADSLIIISWVWDKRKNGYIHPLLKYIGTAIILEHIFEVVCFDNPTWRVVAAKLYQLAA